MLIACERFEEAHSQSNNWYNICKCNRALLLAGLSKLQAQTHAH